MNMPDEESLPQGEVVDRIAVPFDGEGEGEAELTWGQIGLWQSIEDSGMSKTVFYIAEVAHGTTVDDVAAMLGFMVTRHQALRTRLILRDDAPPRQRCSTSGEVTLTVVDAGTHDPADVAEAVSQRWQHEMFDYGRDWPVRLAAIRKDGVLTHVVTVILHTSIDAYGLSALAADIGARDPETGAAAGPVTALQPLEQAARQASPTGRRQNAASLKYLERLLRTIDASRFGEPRFGGERWIDMIHYRSPATLLAVRAVAARERIDDSPVLLASFAVGLARFTGVNPVMAMLMVGNRFRPGLADSVSALIQLSPYMIDVADTTVGDAVSRAAASAINAYKNAYYNPYEQDEVIERVERERGEELDLSCFYNDRRQQARSHLGEEIPAEERIHAALADSHVSWEPEISMPRRKIYFNVDDPPGAIEFVMSVDRRYFDRADMETIMRNIEEAAVQAALEPDAPTRVARRVAAGSAS
jgi:hypothetical protein